MRQDITDLIHNITGSALAHATALDGGCVGDVYKVMLADGGAIVAKAGAPGSGLGLEGFMLRYLAEHSGLPVPEVLHADDDVLIINWIESSGSLGPKEQIHAADLVAALHDITSDSYGFECDTVIGGLHQPNPPTKNWRTFFAEQRLIYMGRQAMDARMLPNAVMARLEKFSGQLDKWLIEPAKPSLIHGDMWSGNVLSAKGRITGFIDPAIYFADPEIELAFSTLFGTFGDTFFGRYQERRPLRPGFFEERRELYNLYPLLVHVRLFGGSYVASVDRTLKKFGF